MFEELDRLFSKTTAPFYIPTSRMRPDFSTSSPVLVIICIFDYSRPGRYQVLLHCGSDFHFSDDYDVEHLFTCLLIICISLGKYLLRSFAQFHCFLFIVDFFSFLQETIHFCYSVFLYNCLICTSLKLVFYSFSSSLV